MPGNQSNSSLCIIPARGGSKRIYKKNIRNFFGKPIIAYSIEKAKKCGLFDEVMVSTDDSEIKQIAEDYGARVPFLRSKKNSGDFASTRDVLVEVINEYRKKSQEFDVCCCLYATAPLIAVETLKYAGLQLFSGDFDLIIPIQKSTYPIEQALKVEGKQVKPMFPALAGNRTQDLNNVFFDSGQFYWFRTSSLEKPKKNSLITGFVELNELASQDIDCETDWKMAELKYRLLHE